MYINNIKNYTLITCSIFLGVLCEKDEYMLLLSNILLQPLHLNW